MPEITRILREKRIRSLERKIKELEQKWRELQQEIEKSYAIETKERSIYSLKKKGEKLHKKIIKLKEKVEAYRRGVMFFTREELEEIQINFERVLEDLRRAEIREEYTVHVPVEDYNLITEYPIEPPFAYVRILQNRYTKEFLYHVAEPVLSADEQRQLNMIKKILLDTILISPQEINTERRTFIRDIIDIIVKDYHLDIDKRTLEKIKYYISRDFAGYGKIDVMMRDPYIEDISCDGVDVPIFVYHRKYGSLKTNVQFKSEYELDNFVIRLAQISGKHISVASPLLDTTLPDGSRAQLTLRREVTARGSTFTIRKFREKPFSPIELIELGTASPEIMAYFWILVEHGASGIFAGGTAAGKTTLLNAVTMFIPPNEKIVSIEDTRELNLPHPNWIPSVTRLSATQTGRSIDMYELLRAALRQRPRYIIVGEVRGKEAYVMFQAMATGHTTYSTFHSEDVQSLINRFTKDPINVPKSLFASLDFIAHIKLMHEERTFKRRISEITEIIDYDPNRDEIIATTSFRWDPVLKRFVFLGKSYIFETIARRIGIDSSILYEELETRAKILEWMRRTGKKTFNDVATVVFKYYYRKDEVLEEANLK